MKKIFIVIPTYNEASNIERLINKIFSLKLNISIIIIDDNSPDGTGSIVEKLKNKFKNKLFIIHRKGKLGLGSAYKTGFKEVIKRKDADLVISMDADFSHDPKYIPSLVKKIDQGYDLVIGSRYIPGGGVSWQFYRRLLSKGANLFANTILNLGVHDVTGAFRCYKKKVLETIPLDQIKSDGFSFFEEILLYCKKYRFKMGEIPIFFLDRQKGKSKLSKKEMIKFFFTIIKLKLTKNNHFHS